MLRTTDAIVLALKPQSDKSWLLHTYTRAHGRENYKVYGIGRHHSAAQYSPLSMVQLSWDEHPNRPIQHLKQARLNHVPTQLTTDPKRQAIAMFVAEVLYRTLTLPMEDESLYNMLAKTVYQIDSATHPENLHVTFLSELAEHMGVGIDRNEHPELTIPVYSRQQRQKQLHELCKYMSEHIENWQEPRSLEILMQVFD